MQPCRLPVGRHIDCHAQINQRHAADDNGELTEADTAAYPAILFRYQATFVLPTHREQSIEPIFFLSLRADNRALPTSNLWTEGSAQSLFSSREGSTSSLR